MSGFLRSAHCARMLIFFSSSHCDEIAFTVDQLEVYIADTLGELGLIYRLAPIVFIGGSLVPHGGQNPIEAVKLKAAIMHGPHVFNFADIYSELDA